MPTMLEPPTATRRPRAGSSRRGTSEARRGSTAPRSVTPPRLASDRTTRWRSQAREPQSSWSVCMLWLSGRCGAPSHEARSTSEPAKRRLTSRSTTTPLSLITGPARPSWTAHPLAGDAAEVEQWTGPCCASTNPCGTPHASCSTRCTEEALTRRTAATAPAVSVVRPAPALTHLPDGRTLQWCAAGHQRPPTASVAAAGESSSCHSHVPFVALRPELPSSSGEKRWLDGP
mmetsp:Transcript_18766/g.50883  ORF Transcript_18766/g.50883 Transcript_18766/m.50883 type:complete len:231 (-) Transcript_18766:99-791(-)